MFSPSNPAQSLARDIALLESPRCPDSIAIKIEQSQLEGKEPVAYKLPRILQSNTTLRKLDLSGSCFIDQYAIEVMHDKPKHEELPPVNSTTVFFFPQQGRTHSVWGYMVIDPKQPSTLNGAILSFGDIARKLEDIKANTGKNYNLYSGWSYASQIELLRAMCDQNLLFATQYESFAYKLAEALKKNTTLEELILHNCQLDSKSFHCLANALKTNTSIKKLDISKNDCFTGPVYRCIEWDEPSGGEFSYCTSHSIDAREDKFFLLTSLIKSCHLESLTLSEKSIETYYKATTASRYKQLEEALKTNSSLIGLNLLGYKDIPIQPKRQYSHYIAPAEAFLLKANEFLVRNKRNKADAAAPRSTRNFF